MLSTTGTESGVSVRQWCLPAGDPSGTRTLAASTAHVHHGGDGKYDHDESIQSDECEDRRKVVADLVDLVDYVRGQRDRSG